MAVIRIELHKNDTYSEADTNTLQEKRWKESNSHLRHFGNRGKGTSRRCPAPLRSPRWSGQIQSGSPSFLVGNSRPSSLAPLEPLHSGPQTHKDVGLEMYKKHSGNTHLVFNTPSDLTSSANPYKHLHIISP